MILVAWACSAPSPSPPSVPPEPSASARQVRLEAGPHPDWVDRRVEEARDRLLASDAGRLVWESIEAHGGLHAWYSSGALSFRFNYQPRNGKQRRDTRQIVDPWSSRAVHELSDDASVRFGWDGQEAWQVVPDGKTLPINARFWALTPYYFVGLPFVLADEGVHLELMTPEPLDGVDHHMVRVTYEDGTGDAPDDYYVLYLDPQYDRLDALRYVVSYPGFFGEGEHSPEKLMVREGVQTVGGLRLPERMPTYAWSQAGRGAHVTEIALTELAFLPPSDWAPELFDAPAEAQPRPGWD